MTTIISQKKAGIGLTHIDAARQPRQRQTICLIGDSWMAQANTSATQNDHNHWFNVANIVLGQRFHVLNYAGVGGEQLSQMRARFNEDVVAYNPGYFCLIGGANDITVGGRSADDMFADYKWMIDRGLEEGIIPIVMPCAPSSNMNTTAEQDTFRDFNWMSREYAKRNGGVIWVDPFRKYMDQAETGYPDLTSTLWDNVHLSVAGNLTIGIEVAAQLDSYLIEYDPFPAHNTEHAGSTNCLMLGTGGTDNVGTSQAPDTWTLNKHANVTATSAKVARTDNEPGEWSQITVSNSVDANRDVEWRSTVQTLADAGLAVGDKIQGFVEYEYDNSPTQLAGVKATLVIDGSGQSVISNFFSSSDDGWTVDGNYGVMATPVVTIGTGATGVRWVIEAVTEAAAASFVVRVGRNCVRKVNVDAADT